jgi:transposase-like protein
MSTTPDPKTKRHWSAAEKAKLVRRHFRDGIPVATIADENETAPSMVHAWIRAVLDGADQVLSDKRDREGQRADKRLAAKDERIRQLEEVTAELSMEVLHLKKGRGAT